MTSTPYRYFIGIDVSKDELDFAVIEQNQLLFHLEVSNDKKGIQTFLQQFKSVTKGAFTNSLFCLEHTGIYNNPLLTFLFQKQAPIWQGRRGGRKSYSDSGKYGRQSH